MKKLYLVIGIVVILALFSSPVLAISKADLISQYKGQSSPTIPTPTPTPYIPMPKGSSPTQTIGVPLVVNSTPTRTMVLIDGTFRGLTPITIGYLSVGTHQLRVSRAGYEDYSTDVLIPEPSCHPSYGGALACEIGPITIDVTLKKVESTQKPTIPTVVPTTAPTQTPTPHIPSSYVVPTPTPTPYRTSGYPLLPVSLEEWIRSLEPVWDDSTPSCCADANMSYPYTIVFE